MKPHTLNISVEMNLEKEAKDSYTVTCPQLGCIFVHEASKEAAIQYAREAIDEYIEISLEHGDPIPADIVVNNTIDADKPRVNLSRPRKGIRFTGATTLTVTQSYSYS